MEQIEEFKNGLESYLSENDEPSTIIEGWKLKDFVLDVYERAFNLCRFFTPELIERFQVKNIEDFVTYIKKRAKEVFEEESSHPTVYESSAITRKTIADEIFKILTGRTDLDENDTEYCRILYKGFHATFNLIPSPEGGLRLEEPKLK